MPNDLPVPIHKSDDWFYDWIWYKMMIGISPAAYWRHTRQAQRPPPTPLRWPLKRRPPAAAACDSAGGERENRRALGGDGVAFDREIYATLHIP